MFEIARNKYENQLKMNELLPVNFVIHVTLGKASKEASSHEMSLLFATFVLWDSARLMFFSPEIPHILLIFLTYTHLSKCAETKLGV
jgi:hypothetical protein